MSDHDKHFWFIFDQLQYSTMDIVDITEKKLSVEDITDLVSDDTCGAVSIFIGKWEHYYFYKLNSINYLDQDSQQSVLSSVSSEPYWRILLEL